MTSGHIYKTFLLIGLPWDRSLPEAPICAVRAYDFRNAAERLGGVCEDEDLYLARCLHLPNRFFRPGWETQEIINLRSRRDGLRPDTPDNSGCGELTRFRRFRLVQTPLVG